MPMYKCPVNGFTVDELNYYFAEREMGCEECGAGCAPHELAPEEIGEPSKVEVD